MGPQNKWILPSWKHFMSFHEKLFLLYEHKAQLDSKGIKNHFEVSSTVEIVIFLFA